MIVDLMTSFRLSQEVKQRERPHGNQEFNRRAIDRARIFAINPPLIDTNWTSINAMIETPMSIPISFSKLILILDKFWIIAYFIEYGT